jgi:peptidoglycan-N-acetylglucosamine deacetylase
MTRRLLLQTLAAAQVKPWRAAVSISFDDGRLSQIDTGLPLLKKLDLKATFYVLASAVSKRLDGWKQIAAEGHEIANHSTSHPCSANHAFSAKNALEDFSLERMEQDLDQASADIERLLKIKPQSFAYPCGQKFDEAMNDPMLCDFAQLNGTGFDGSTWEQMKAQIEDAARQHRWLIFVGHDIGKPARQTTDTEALARLADYVKNPANGVWFDTVAGIANSLKSARRG